LVQQRWNVNNNVLWTGNGSRDNQRGSQPYHSTLDIQYYCMDGPWVSEQARGDIPRCQRQEEAMQ
jgi:hypothetical protein